MEETYSFKKGLGKGLLSVLSVCAAMAMFSGFSDVMIWDLLEKYLKPVIGLLTVNGLITMAINWIKFNVKVGRARKEA